MKKLQQRVKAFCRKHNLDSPVEYRVLDTVSELGEVAKEILKMSRYGRKPLIINNEIKQEMGDVFYSLISVANALDIDLETALHDALNKYERRLEHGSPGSETEGT